MKLLERYIFRRTFALTVITLAATTLMVLVTQVLLYVNLLTASGQALLSFFALAATLVPPMTNLVLPFALHIGASQTLNGMNSDSELAVIEAAGGPRSIQTRPILLLALLLSLASLAISHFAEPFAEQSKRQPDQDHERMSGEDQPHNGSRLRAKGHANPDFARPLPHGIRKHPEHADAGERERERAKHSGQQRTPPRRLETRGENRRQ